MFVDIIKILVDIICRYYQNTCRYHLLLIIQCLIVFIARRLKPYKYFLLVSAFEFLQFSSFGRALPRRAIALPSRG